ncbi:MAG TPA: ABC transporter ATP-binding protein [Gemmatimonadales bacterium]|nr:ABC transporter ATP-binding protein [Gemmatimonadales bacterium]
MTDYALTLSDVTGRGLGPASLALLPGEIAGLVGPARAGKTMLLRVTAGASRPRTGEVRVWGMRVTNPAARQLVGYASDNPAFPHALTVQEVLMYYARLHCAASNERAPRGLVLEALEIAGLTAAAALRVEGLGRADLHRLSFAQAAMGGRRVLLLDETLSGLDAFARRDLRGRIARLAAEGVAVLITARDPAALERLAARVLVMRDGRIVRAGPLATLLGERILEVILDGPPAEPPPGFRITAAGLEAPLTGRTVEAALALCRAHRLPVRASRVRVKSLEEIVLETHDAH